MKTFKCDFGKGVSCEIQVHDGPPENGNTHIIRTEWVGQPSRKMLHPYISWMNTVNKILSDEWGVSLMHVFLTSKNGDAEIWQYSPGTRPRKLGYNEVYG